MHVCNINSLQVHCLNSVLHWLLNCRPEIGLACSDPRLAVCIGPIFGLDPSEEHRDTQQSSGLEPDTGEQISVNQLCP